MIYITGDTHGEYTRFRTDVFPEQLEMTKDDYVIVCGDFGIWDKSEQSNFWLNRLNEKPFTILFVTGNHSNYDILKEYPVSEWNGGKVQFIRPSIIHLMRGQIFNIDGRRILTMGGAACHDIPDGPLSIEDPHFERKYKQLVNKWGFCRVEHLSWWKEELPNDEEYAEAYSNLEAADWEVDYIVSHCCPSKYQALFANCDLSYTPNRLTDFFDEISERCCFKQWFCGHYHQNNSYNFNGKAYTVLYKDIIRAV